MIEAIKNRRSIRKYKNEAVDKEAIVQILQAGIPSVRLQTVWRDPECHRLLGKETQQDR